MKALITSKGQVTIPRVIRERFGLKAGQAIEFDEKAPFIKAHPVIDEERARALFGSKKKELAGKSVEEWLEWLRGPVELPPKNARRRR
jgi:AbrB family looped-hinge helix DNA binding protein